MLSRVGDEVIHKANMTRNGGQNLLYYKESPVSCYSPQPKAEANGNMSCGWKKEVEINNENASLGLLVLKHVQEEAGMLFRYTD